MNTIEFTASLAVSASALKIAHSGRGRIVLAFDEAQLPQVLRLLLWRDRLLQVAIRPAEADEVNGC